MEDSLRREDVETMSRENMKNLHEIMQVTGHQDLLSLDGIKSIKTKLDHFSKCKPFLRIFNIHEIFFLIVRIIFRNLRFLSFIFNTEIHYKMIFSSRSDSVTFATGAISPGQCWRYSCQSDSSLFIGAGGCQIFREISTAMSTVSSKSQ